LLDGQTQYITAKGYWYVATHQATIGSKIDKFASSDELAPILPYLPSEALRAYETTSSPMPPCRTGTIPIDVALSIMRRINNLEKDISAFQRRHALAFEGLYDKLADEEDLVEWKSKDVIPLVFGIPYDELSAAGQLAIDRFARQKENGVISARLDGVTDSYWVQSKRSVREQAKVVSWARMYQETAAKAAAGKDVKDDLRSNPLSAFINKAHRLILQSRKIRSPTTIGILGPSAESGDGGAITAVDTGETLTKNDKMIIQFIHEASQMLPSFCPPAALSICSLIYRAIGAYPNLALEKKVACLLLQELGVMSPWKDRGMNIYKMRLPGLGIWPYQERLVANAATSCKDIGAFQLSDKYPRKDWGETPVYCIDSADTVEIDDGISVERHANLPDCIWVHVHIANPAAFISREHPIALAAKDIVASTYSPSRRYAMMPEDFPRNFCSLAADRPVMTVSTLLQADGSVADIEMSLGIIHNVVKLTHIAINHALEEENEERGQRRELATMVIGGDRPAQTEDGMDSESLRHALPDLLLMRRYLHSRWQTRQNDWPVEERMTRHPTTLRANAWTSIKEESLPLWTGRINHWRGDPVLVVEGDRLPRSAGDFDYTQFVDHVMLLAGESAAKWCKDREIPIFYQVATPHPLYPISKLNELKETDYRVEPAGRLSAVWQPHWILKMMQYTKLTSPIRRYNDLVNQWQIHAYLQASQEVKDSRPRDLLRRLPFTSQELEEMVGGCSNRTTLMRRALVSSTDFCIEQALFRAFHFKEAELPEIWDLKVKGPSLREAQSPKHTGIMGYLSPFPIRAELLHSDEKWEQSAWTGQYLPVRISMVDVEQRKVDVIAVGPPSDTVNTTQPIHIQSSKKAALSGKVGPERQR
jgi:RNB domain